jgi:hypothetical protein
MDRAMNDFRAGNFRPALQNFQRTFDLTGNPAILFNIAVTWQRLGEPGEAARALRRYLIAQPQALNRADVEQQPERSEFVAASTCRATAPPRAIDHRTRGGHGSRRGCTGHRDRVLRAARSGSRRIAEHVRHR